MRKPATIEKLYLDFDGFFASVMQQAQPSLRGKPIGVIPFAMENARSTVVIACSKEAKARGCKNVMPVPEALSLCPELILVPQRPDLFRRAHMALLNEIACEIPIETIKSIDELTCKLSNHDIGDPKGLAARIKRRIHKNIGGYITCSIGFASNRMLSKIACKVDKPDGVTIWHVEDMPGPLLPRPISDVPGIGSRLEERLARAGITTMEGLLNTQPKQLRTLWGNVNGERMWYALHGYDLHATPTGRSMFGHGRVLPPAWRTIDKAQACSRLLLTKAARRMRRDHFYANGLHLWIGMRGKGWSADHSLPSVQDDHACLAGLDTLWERAKKELPRSAEIVRVGVTLQDLVSDKARQLDMFLADDVARQKWESITNTIDDLNRRYGQRVITMGAWEPPPGGYAGGKISYTRIPSAEDFY